MNISQHSFVPTCQYIIDTENNMYVSTSGRISSGVSIPRYSLAPNNSLFDTRFNRFEFDKVNSILFLSSILSNVRPFIGFARSTPNFGAGIYLPYSILREDKIVTSFIYSVVSGADVETSDYIYISDGSLDCFVRYVFWNEKVFSTVRFNYVTFDDSKI